MLSGVSTICFAASYTIAFLLEVSRLAFRSSVRGALMLGFAAAGLVAHTAFLYDRAANAAGAPLSSEKDWFLVAAWALVVVYLYLAVLHPKVPFGLFLLPLSLGLIAAAAFLAKQSPLPWEAASRVWGAIHGLSIMLAAIAVLIGCMAGAMYLVQSRRLKRRRLPAGGLRLPSLEWLQWTNSRAVVFSTLMLGIGVLSGIVLNLIRGRDATGRFSWADPVIVSTGLMLVWLLVGGAIGVVYRPARQGRKMAYLTVISFFFLVLVLAAGLLMESPHWNRRESNARPACHRLFPEVPMVKGEADPAAHGTIAPPQAVCAHCVERLGKEFPISRTLLLEIRPAPGGRPC